MDHNNLVLIDETGSITNALLESKNKRPGCLGQLRGPIAEWKNPTANDHYYSLNLWNRVFNLEWVQDAIKKRVLFGEADHPEVRLEPSLVNAAVVLTDYQFRNDEQDIIGTFDILDTPTGRILHTLATYGCVLGVSSRGRGSLSKVNGRNTVDEDSYVFGGFDIVATPAIKKARTEFIAESTAPESTGKSQFKSMTECITRQVLDCNKIDELKIIRGMLNESGLEDIVSQIDAKIACLSESASTPQADTHAFEDCIESANNAIVKGLTNDLKQAYLRIAYLKSKLESQSPKPDDDKDVDEDDTGNDVNNECSNKDERDTDKSTKSKNKSSQSDESEYLKSGVTSETSNASSISMEESAEMIRLSNELLSENMSLHDTINVLNADLAEKTALVSKLKQRQAELTESLRKPTTINESNPSGYAKATSENSIGMDEHLDAVKLSNEYLSENMALHDTVNALNADLAEKSELINKLRQRQTELVESLHAHVNGSSQIDVNIVTQPRPQSATNSLAQNDSDLRYSKLKDEYQRVLADYDGIKSEYESIVSENEQLTQLVENLRLENAKLISDYNDIVDELKDVNQELAKLRFKYLEHRATRMGLKAETLVKMLPTCYTTEDVDSLIASQLAMKRRSNALAIASPPVSANESTVLGVTNNATHNDGLDSARALLTSMRHVTSAKPHVR